MSGAVRRLAVAAAALLLAAALLHGQVALALVYRGDDALARANLRGAATYYQRARLLDPQSTLVSDRLAFAAFLANDARAMRAALGWLDDAISRYPADTQARSDRVLLEMRLRERDRAAQDWAFIGARNRDARALAFAGILYRRAGQCGEARTLMVRALKFDPKLLFARRSLGRAC